MKELFAPSDMTVGKPWEKIVAFTIPMLIGNIAQQLYNTVDSIVIGKYVGDNALAAVGSASPILNLLLVLFVGISVGAGVMVSQYFGARQRKELSMTIGNCVTLTAISSIIIMILGLGTGATVFYNMISNMLRALKTAAGNAENTGFYHRLVYLVSGDPDGGLCRQCVL